MSCTGTLLPCRQHVRYEVVGREHSLLCLHRAGTTSRPLSARDGDSARTLALGSATAVVWETGERKPGSHGLLGYNREGIHDGKRGLCA